MTGARLYPTPHGGLLRYEPRLGSSRRRFPSLVAQPRCRPSRITTAEIIGPAAVTDRVSPGLSPKQQPKSRVRRKRTLAAARESETFRRLRSIIANHSLNVEDEIVSPVSRTGSRREELGVVQDMPGPDFLRAGARNSGSRNNSVSNGSSVPSPSRSRQGSVANTTASVVPEERPVASGHGVSVSVNLAEPVLFLQGFEPGDASQRSTAMLRGTLHLKVLKSAKIKAVNLRFKGTACTKWPEGKCFRFDEAYITDDMKAFLLKS